MFRPKEAEDADWLEPGRALHDDATLAAVLARPAIAVSQRPLPAGAGADTGRE
jgi:hypothetical protein